MHSTARRLTAPLACLLGLALPSGAAAGATDTPGHARPGVARPQGADPEVTLARRYAPVVRLRAQPEPCGPGEPYRPIAVGALMGNDEVALVGPWARDALVKVAPTAVELSRGLPGYHLDLPGDPLSPGCDYEELQHRLHASSTVYARTATQRGRPGRLALQYWFFYVYNDYNNKHEGDWEMIQLDFDAPDARAALASGPVEVGYSQHEGAERARWGDPKLALVDGTHPVVYPAEGSHANFFEPSLYLGRSGAQGVGCDDTKPPHTSLRPRVATIPSDWHRAVARYPWLAYRGHWGEQQESFYNGPTGPKDKLQWSEPFTWSGTTWRDASFPVPLNGVLGTSATSLFCGSVEAGSNLLRQLTQTPTLVLGVLAALVALALWAATRTRWSPAPIAPLVAARAWGQMLVAARRAYRSRPALFAGIGLPYLATATLAGLAQAALFHRTGLADFREVAGSTDGYVLVLVLAVGVLFSLLTFVVVLAGTAAALAALDAGEPVTARSALGEALRHLAPLAWITVVGVPTVALLASAMVTAPLALAVLVGGLWSVHAAVIEGRPARAALRRSRRLVRGHWWRTAGILALVGGIGALTGPLVGVGLLLVTSASFGFVNAVAALVYAVTIPFVALVLTYMYGDLRFAEQRHLADRGHAPAEPTGISGGAPQSRA